MKKPDHSDPGKAIGEVVVRVASGLSSGPARQISGHARQFRCTATLANVRGDVADARSLFELLSLGAAAGERVTLRCIGSDAHAAYEVIADVLTGGSAR